MCEDWYIFCIYSYYSIFFTFFEFKKYLLEKYILSIFNRIIFFKLDKNLNFGPIILFFKKFITIFVIIHYIKQNMVFFIQSN